MSETTTEHDDRNQKAADDAAEEMYSLREIKDDKIGVNALVNEGQLKNRSTTRHYGPDAIREAEKVIEDYFDKNPGAKEMLANDDNERKKP